MKSLYILPLIPLMLGVATAQMPTNSPQSFDASGKSAQAQAGVQNDDPNRFGETPPPQVFGMELPLLDPSTDTVSFNGGKFDVGNNAMVRERFEKYLNQTPDDIEASRKYCRAVDKLIKKTQKYSKNAGPVGSKVLVEIGMSLYDLSEYPGDGQQSGALASGMVSVLDAQRANLRRDKANAQLDEDIEKLVKKTNSLTNQNTQKGSGGGNIGNIQGKSGASGGVSHTVQIAANTQKIAENKTKQGANVAANEASLLRAKIQYQALLLSLFMQRRFDHVVIGARSYRHLFRDGDTTLNLDKESDAYQMFTGISGMPPTVNALDTAASNARRDIDQSMDSIVNLLAQNKLGEATNRLITAVAVGEFMQSVARFPEESRRRIAEYWTLRKNALVSLNARDYAEVERISNRLKELDADYNDSMLMSYVDGKKTQSDSYLIKAKKSWAAGQEEDAEAAMANATAVWPRNPNIKKAREELEKIVAYEKERNEFISLVKAKRFRDVYKDQDRLAMGLGTSPELQAQYKAVIRFIELIDNSVKEYREIEQQQGVMGAGLAYEKLLERQNENEALDDPLLRGEMKNDKLFSDALRDMRDAAGEFTDALDEAHRHEKNNEYGSALYHYYRALDLNPTSVMAKEGIKRVYDVLYSAQF